MHFKTDGGKWIRGNMKPKDATKESFSSPGEFKTFLDIHTSVCKDFRHISY
jgi:hypothetical protein